LKPQDTSGPKRLPKTPLTVVAAAAIVAPVAAQRRTGWIALPIAMLAALISGTLVFSAERCAKLLSR
jgi:hypothetical protein